MEKVKQDLLAVTKQLKALVGKTESLAKKVEKLEKPQAAAKTKPKAKPKAKKAVAKRKAPAKKKVAAKKTTAKKKAPAKKKTAAKKKAVKPTATDQVLKIIGESKKGVDVPGLMRKTGFDERKVRNIVFKANKEEKVKRAGRGVYLAK